jgi:D-arabinose 1-dehydrogenase-like Zn-dependent alcohol dehydrogenase
MIMKGQSIKGNAVSSLADTDEVLDFARRGKREVIKVALAAVTMGLNTSQASSVSNQL